MADAINLVRHVFQISMLAMTDELFAQHLLVAVMVFNTSAEGIHLTVLEGFLVLVLSALSVSSLLLYSAQIDDDYSLPCSHLACSSCWLQQDNHALSISRGHEWGAHALLLTAVHCKADWLKPTSQHPALARNS